MSRLPVAMVAMVTWLTGSVLQGSPASGRTDTATAVSEQPVLAASLGITGGVGTTAFSADGTMLVTAGADGIAILWDIATGGEIRRFRSRSAEIVSVQLFDGDRRLLTGSVDGRARIWDTATGAELYELSAHVGTLGHGTPYGQPFAVSRDGRIVVTAVEEGKLQVWDGLTGAPERQLTHGKKDIGFLALSTDGGMLLVAGWDGTGLYDLASGARRWMVKEESGPVALSPAAPAVLTSDIHNHLHLRALADGRELKEFAGHELGIWSVAFSPDGRRVVSGGYDNAARIWDVESGRQVQRLEHPANVASVGFDPPGRHLVTADWHGNVILRDPGTGAEVKRLRNSLSALRLLGFAGGRPRIVAAGGRGDALVWDPYSGSAAVRLQGHSAPVLSARLSGDGKRILTGSIDHTASLWDATTGFELQRYEWLRGEISAVALGANDQTVLTICEEADLWDAVPAHHQRTLNAKMLGFLGADLSPDGTEVVARQILSFGLQAFDARDGHELWAREGAVEDVRFSPDGKLVAAASAERDGLLLLGAADGKPARKTPAHGAVVAVAFSADGRRLLSVGADRVARVLDLTTGRESPEMRQPHDVHLAALSPDGALALTGGEGRAYLWDVRRGALLCTMALFQDGGWIVLDPEGRFDAFDLDRPQGVYWLLPSQPFHLLAPEIFVRSHYEPQLLRRLLESPSDLATVPPLAGLDRRQPEVQLIDIRRSRPDSDTIDVSVEASWPAGVALDARSSIRDLHLFRDGQLVAQSAPAAATPPSVAGQPLRVTFKDIHLPNSPGHGEIELSAYAFNEDGVKSPTVRRTYTVPPGLAPRQGRAYLIAFGVDSFEDPAFDLHYAVSDARGLRDEIRDALLRTGEFGRDVIPVTLVSVKEAASDPPLKGEGQATKAQLRAVLDVLAGRRRGDDIAAAVPGGERLAPATPDDLVFLSFSTHGTRGPSGELYLAPHDLGPAGTEIARRLQHWISSDELADWLHDVDAGTIEMVIDACHSAASLDAAGFKPGPLGSRGLGQLAYDKGMRVLAASRVDSVAIESGVTRHGFLTYALAAGLESHAADWRPPDGAITTAEWLSYAVWEVPELQRQLRAGETVAPLGAGRTKDASLAPEAGGPPPGPWVQEPVFFDFARRARDPLLLGDASLEPALQVVADPGLAVADEERAGGVLKALLHEEDGRHRAAGLYRFIASHPGSPRLGEAYAALVGTLLDLGSGGRELLAAARMANAFLRAPQGPELELRFKVDAAVAAALADQGAEPAGALDLARQALRLVPAGPENGKLRSKLEALVARLLPLAGAGSRQPARPAAEHPHE